jgi:hypothetical protein
MKVPFQLPASSWFFAKVGVTAFPYKHLALETPLAVAEKAGS